MHSWQEGRGGGVHPVLGHPGREDIQGPLGEMNVMPRGCGGLQENGVVAYNVGYSVICGIADILPLRVSAKYDIVHV